IEAWVFADRGETYQSMERHAEALADFDRAIELDPNYEWAIASRGETYQSMGRYADAQADYEEAIRLDPSDGWTIYLLAQLWRQQGREEEARERLRAAVEVDRANVSLFPRDGWKAMNVIIYLAALGEFERAAEHLRETLRRELHQSAIVDAIRDLQEISGV